VNRDGSQSAAPESDVRRSARVRMRNQNDTGGQASGSGSRTSPQQQGRRPRATVRPTHLGEQPPNLGQDGSKNQQQAESQPGRNNAQNPDVPHGNQPINITRDKIILPVSRQTRNRSRPFSIESESSSRPMTPRSAAIRVPNFELVH
jgi:hypothetical protein